MKTYRIKQLTQMTSLEEDDIHEQLSFIARILPEGIRQESTKEFLLEDTALKILKDLAEKETHRI
jgi:hypothetical protein